MDKKILILLIQSFLWSIIYCANFNITNMSNCLDVPLDYQNDAEVETMNIVYQRNAKNFVDTVSGEFMVHVQREHKDTELVLWFFKCPKGSTGVCSENKKEFTENLNCKRFLEDDSGPWHMFAPAMDKRNVCAEAQGRYSITNATIFARHVEKYMKVEEGHYRIKTIYHLPGEDFSVRNLRGCIELDFDIYDD